MNAAVRPIAQRHPVRLPGRAFVVGGLLGWSRPWRGIVTPLLAAAGVGTINQNDFSVAAMFVSFIGAAILLAIVNLLRRGTAR